MDSDFLINILTKIFGEEELNQLDLLLKLSYQIKTDFEKV